MKNDLEDEQWELLPEYVQTLSSFIMFSSFPLSAFFCIQKGAVNMIKFFPSFQYAHYHIVIDGMAMTLFYLKNTQYFDVFVENIVYQGKLTS